MRAGLLLASGSACTPTFEDNTSRIDKARILAIKSEPAEPAPGDMVQLSALVASSEGAQGSNLSWKFCTLRKPATEAGPVAQACVEEFGEEGSDALVDIGAGPSVDGSVDSDACRLFGPLSPPQAPGQSDSGRPADPDETGGYYQPLLVSLPSSEDSALDPVFGRVRLLCGGAGVPQEELVKFNRGYRPNVNPLVKGGTLSAEGTEHELVLGDGAAVTATLPPETEIQLRLTFESCPSESVCGDGLCTVNENPTTCAEDCRENAQGCSGAEKYLWANAEERKVNEREESLSVTWFATDGSFSENMTDNLTATNETRNSYVTPSSAGEVRLWFVVTDSRGGAGWTQITLNVEP